MSEHFDDDALLATLGAALAPEPSPPSPDQMAALHSALAARTGIISAAVPDAVVVPFDKSIRVPRTRSAGIHRLRHPVAVLVGMAVLATSGVAAAGVATDTMPGPARHVAYSIGLPVTSPALENARSTISALELALQRHDRAAVVSSSTLLSAQIAALSASDRVQIEGAAIQLLASADTYLNEVASPESSKPVVLPTADTGTSAPGGADSSGQQPNSASTDRPGSGEPAEHSGGPSAPSTGGESKESPQGIPGGEDRAHGAPSGRQTETTGVGGEPDTAPDTQSRSQSESEAPVGGGPTSGTQEVTPLIAGSGSTSG